MLLIESLVSSAAGEDDSRVLRLVSSNDWDNRNYVVDDLKHT